VGGLAFGFCEFGGFELGGGGIRLDVIPNGKGGGGLLGAEPGEPSPIVNGGGGDPGS
jgi:hypothetical protein